MENLHYRRQYVITSQTITIFKNWQHHSFQDRSLQIYTHPDLEIATVAKADKELFLLGFMLDHQNIDASNQSILETLVNEPDFDSFLTKTFDYGGRYLIVYKDKTTLRIVPDNFAFRELYYHFNQHEFWAASQPHLLGEFVALEKRQDPDYQEFMNSPLLNLQSKGWMSYSTPFVNVFHLPSNHYLDLIAQKTQRFWPSQPLKSYSLTEGVELAAKYLQGFLLNAQKRYNIMVPVTAGWDSRVTLAATKLVKDQTFYFVNMRGKLTRNSADIQVPSKLSQLLKFNFKVVDLPKFAEIDPKFIEIYKANYFFGLDEQIPTHYSFYKNYENRLNILTTGSETARNFHKTTDHITPEVLADMSNYKGLQMVIKHCQNWLNDAENIAQKNNIRLLDLYYWENRLCNWGASSSTYADIARETLSLYNCRSLMQIMLGVDNKYRQHNNELYKGLMEKLWAEVLVLPLNPPQTIKAYIKRYTKKLGLFMQIRKLYRFFRKG
jgi:hypothetical protein